MSKTAKKIASWFKSFNQKCDKTKQDGIVVKFWNAMSEEGRDKARNEMADLIQCTIEKNKDCSLEVLMRERLRGEFTTSVGRER